MCPLPFFLPFELFSHLKPWFLVLVCLLLRRGKGGGAWGLQDAASPLDGPGPQHNEPLPPHSFFFCLQTKSFLGGGVVTFLPPPPPFFFLLFGYLPGRLLAVPSGNHCEWQPAFLGRGWGSCLRTAVVVAVS